MTSAPDSVANAIDALVLIGPDNPDPAGNAECRECAAAVSRRLDVPVYVGFREYATPTLTTVLEACIQAGGQQIALLPLLLDAASHYQRDMPSIVAQARMQWPFVVFRCAQPAGLHTRIVHALAEQADAAYATSITTVADAATALLLVGCGSSVADINANVCKVARYLWELEQYAWVEAAFQSVTQPDVVQGVTRCVRLGARRVIIVPFVLFTGVACNDIGRQAQVAQTQHPAVEILVARHLGEHPGVIETVVQRYHEMLQAAGPNTCDLCVDQAQVNAHTHSNGLRPTCGQPHPHHYHQHHGFRGVHNLIKKRT